jgi:hypothetical protein
MPVLEGQIYACQYKNTYSILVVADGLNQARQIFLDWMIARKEHISVDDLVWLKVKRTFKQEERPIYFRA